MIQSVTTPKTKATVEDLRRLYGEDSRYELIHGELVEKAMPRVEHVSGQGGFFAALRARFHRRSGDAQRPGGWWILPELHVRYGDDELYCHDLCGYRRDKHSEIPNGWPVRVTPDWVCELLSPGHHKRDRVDKWNTLFRARVPHYWLVNPEEKFLEVYRWTPDGYVLALQTTADDLIRAEPFDAVELRAAVLFDDEDDV